MYKVNRPEFLLARYSFSCFFLMVTALSSAVAAARPKNVHEYHKYPSILLLPDWFHLFALIASGFFLHFS